MTAVKTAVPVINEDVQSPENNLESLSYSPQQTLSQRLATASDPRTPLPNVSDALSAIVKVGTIGFNAVKTVIQTVATPTTIAAVATAGAANPLAIVGILGAKLGEAAVTLVPPATQERWVSNAFDAFKSEFSANSQLFEVSSLLKYWDAAKQHTSYGEVAATPTGQPPTTLVANWIAAAARDIAGKGTDSAQQADANTLPWLLGGSTSAPTTTVLPTGPSNSDGGSFPWGSGSDSAAGSSSSTAPTSTTTPPKTDSAPTTSAPTSTPPSGDLPSFLQGGGTS